jgi:ATP/maltotriose-dependent transcriptional regulator MalT
VAAGDGEWPLVGRTAELERVNRILAAGAGGVVLAGPAGVGKTRLATECLRLAAERDFVPVRVAGTQAARSLPFGAFAPFVPELAATADRADVLRQVTRALVGRGQGKPIALLVDDAYLLDEGSAALMHQLAASEETFVLATVRSGERASDAVVALWKDGLADRLDLSPLTAEQVDALLGIVLGGPADGSAVRLFWERTEGNPLFLRELVVAAREAGVLTDDGGLWRVRGQLPASARLVELVESRVGDLEPDEREALELLAVWEPIGAEPFERLSGQGVLESLEHRRLVRLDAEGRRLKVRLAHPLYSDVLRARLSPLRSRTLSRTMADSLEATGMRRREDLLRVATWRLDGGGAARPDVMLTAAQQARTRWALPLAERLTVAAVDAGAGFGAAVLLGQLYWLQGRADEAEHHMAELVSRATTDADRASLATTRMAGLLFAGRASEALRIGEEAERVIADVGARDLVTIKRASLLATAGQTLAAQRLIDPIMSRADGVGLAWSCMIASFCLGRLGQLTLAHETAERGLRVHQSLADPPTTLGEHFHHCMRQFALVHAGRLLTAEEIGRAVYRRAVEEGSGEALALFPRHLASTLLLRGRVREAARLAREAANRSRELNWTLFNRSALMTLAYALALMGAADEAQASLQELAGLGIPPTAMYSVELLQTRAWIAVASGDLPAARRHLEAAVGVAAANGELVPHAHVLHDLARLGMAKDVAPRLAELVGAVDGDLVRTQATHARALTENDPEATEAASMGFEAIGADLLAAEAAAEAAVAWRKHGDVRRAAGAERRAHSLAARCEGARTPALVAITAQAALSARELEIARLAAAGVSNKEIASRLFLSVRTVENKLHTAYEKLGVDGRAELADALQGY